MNRGLFLITVIALSGLASGYQEDVKLPLNEEIEYGNETVEYSSLEGLGRSLTIENSRGIIERRYSGKDFYDVLGERLEIGEISLVPESIDREGKQLKAEIDVPRELIGGSELNVTAPEYIVKEQGETFSIPLEISNQGGVQEDYRLRAETPKNTGASFVFKGYNVTGIATEPGDTKRLKTEIDIDEEAETGPKRINLSASDRSFSAKTFEFTVTGSSDEERQLSMRLEQSYAEREAGKKISTEIRIRNIGDSSVEDIEPEISVPDGWNSSLSPERIGNISSDQFQDFEVSTAVPSTASSGDYFVEIGLENTDDFDEKTLRVNVSSQSDGLGASEYYWL